MRDKKLIGVLGAILEAIKLIAGPEKFRLTELQIKIQEAQDALEATGYYCPDDES